VKRLAKAAAIVIVCGLIFTAGYLSAGRLGFAEGYIVGSCQADVTAAHLVVCALRQHESGKVEKAHRTLEDIVDIALTVYSSHMDWEPRFRSRESLVDLTKPLKNICRYRRDHPSESRVTALDLSVREVIERYAD